MAVDEGIPTPPGTPAAPPGEGGDRTGAALLSLGALVVALALTFQAWRAARGAEELEQGAAFHLRAADTQARVERRMEAYELVLSGLEGLFAASVTVERDEFRAYVASLALASSFPGIQGVGYGILVPAARREWHEAAVRREGFPGYAVHPAGAGEPFAAVVFIEPFEGRNLRAFGYDMLSEPTRRAAMERARDTGRAALTSRVTLVVEGREGVQAGAILYRPIYRKGARVGSVEERRAALLGWVYSAFRMQDLMRGILTERPGGLDVALYDGEEASPAALMFGTGPDALGSRPAPRLREARALEIAGRRWTMVLDARADQAPAPLATRSTLVAAAGVAVGAVLALILWVLGAGRARALQAARRSGHEAAARRRAAEEVELARRFAQATLDAMPEQICVLDEAGVVLSVNLAWREFGAANGAPPGGLDEGTAYLAACERAGAAGEPGAAQMAAGLRELLAGQRDAFVHEYGCHSATRRRWFVARACRFADGARVRLVLAHQDVTDRLEAEVALRESEERLRIATAAAGQVDWSMEAATGRCDIGAGWTRLTGRPLPAPGSLDALLELTHPDDRQAVQAGLRACGEGRAPRVDVEHRLLAARGAWRWVRTGGQVTTRDGAGRPLRMAGTITDIDEVHALQEKLLAATRLASVGTLAAGVAHEINNPLSWMHANLSLALEQLERAGPAPEGARAELRHLLAESLEGTDRIAAIVKAMRSLGRPERAEQARLLDLGGELRHAVQLVRHQLQQRAELVLDLPAGLPPVRARTSELGRVFLNLLLNAAHAVAEVTGRAHRIEVVARAAGGEVVVEVRDSGPGIPAEVRQRIFDPFFTTKPVGQGTGLGLAIARSIVDAAGGRIEVDSEVGRGATFRVHLPAALEDAPALAPAPAPAAVAARRRVLVVDDEPMVSRSLERLLSRTHDVTVLASGEEALRRLDAGERWDALLVDLMMPGLDGPAVHAALAARHPALLGRLAFITGGAFGERATGFLADHPVPVLAKPIQLAALLELVERLAAD